MNKDFKRKSNELEGVGIHANDIFLKLVDESLEGVIIDNNNTEEIKKKIIQECIINPIYFFREVTPHKGLITTKELLSLYFFSNSIDQINTDIYKLDNFCMDKIIYVLLFTKLDVNIFTNDKPAEFKDIIFNRIYSYPKTFIEALSLNNRMRIYNYPKDNIEASYMYSYLRNGFNILFDITDNMYAPLCIQDFIKYNKNNKLNEYNHLNGIRRHTICYSGIGQFFNNKVSNDLIESSFRYNKNMLNDELTELKLHLSKLEVPYVNY